MSFLLRRSRHSIGRFRAGVDADDTAARDADDGGSARAPTVADAHTAFAQLTDSDLRAVAGRAVAADAFSDGLPIRMSLD